MRAELVLLLFASRASANLNRGGVPYAISNPPGSTAHWVGTPGEYETDFERSVTGEVRHFDVYGEVRTSYSQVYWTRNAPVPLPPELVREFANGGVMAITGYEVDQVTHPHQHPPPSNHTGVLSGFSCYPDCGANDVSVPIYHAYNHHYFSWLIGAGAEVGDLDRPTLAPNPTRTFVKEPVRGPADFPRSIVFKENPGGEFRKSYHGYPSGYAQLVAEPTHWVVEPMQIDTHNRNVNLTDASGHTRWHLPKQVSDPVLTELDGGLSPLIECPCTDRISKGFDTVASLRVDGVCAAPVPTYDGCVGAVGAVATVASSEHITDASRPSGCLLVPQPRKGDAPVATAVFNSARSSASCRPPAGGKLRMRGFVSADGLRGAAVNLSIAHDGREATISLSGPAGSWFGVGLDATSMADLPYALIVDGKGGVQERRLANHGPGRSLRPSVKVVSTRVVAGVMHVKLVRAVAGATPEHFSIPTAPREVPLIVAVGATPTLERHRAHASTRIALLPERAEVCVCEPARSAYLTYMNQSRTGFGYACEDEPRGDMLRRGDGTGRARPNAACDVETYHGGLGCCRHGFLLTDVAQESLIRREEVDVYFLKWRFYFQTYVRRRGGVAASHKHLHHWVFLIDAQINDYEEDNAHYGTASVGQIRAHITANQFCDAGCDSGQGRKRLDFRSLSPIVMTPHCHAPSCIREELWNADTGEIICNVSGTYGSARYGSLDAVFNERDYIAIPPCLFGHQPGLQRPFVLGPYTNITAIKYFNNTYRHLGQMAQWTGLAVYDDDLI